MGSGNSSAGTVRGRAVLGRQDWVDLLREDRRRGHFARRPIALAVLALAFTGFVAVRFGAVWSGWSALYGAVVVALYALTYTRIGPLLAARSLTPHDLALRWEADEKSILIDRGGRVETYPWAQIATLSRGRHVVALHLPEPHACLALPLRELSQADLALLARWCPGLD